MLIISPTDSWSTQHPEATIGVLEISGVDNRGSYPALNERKNEIENALRAQYQGFSRPDFNALPIIETYRRYYKQFKKSYHVQLQLESIVLKGKSLPNVSPLVDANFMAEVEHLVLTAGHDAAKLHAPIQIDVSQEGDEIVQMIGRSKAMRPGDMIMRDAQGISCSIIYGQDNRSPITPATTHVLYIAYGPPGVTAENITAQFEAIKHYISLFSPTAAVEQQRLILAT